MQGLAFKREDGSTFPWRGCSDFSLFHRFIVGEDIQPILDERRGLGANILRVFAHYNAAGIGTANGLGALDRDMYGAEDVSAFFDLLEANGLRCEWVLFADDGTLTLSQGQAVVDQYSTVLSRQLVELCNEPDALPLSSSPKNIGFDLSKLKIPAAWVWATGYYTLTRGQRTLWRGTHVTNHGPRRPEWPRNPRANAEMRDGFSWELTPDEIAAHPDWALEFEGTDCPVVDDEPTGADEVPSGDSRSSTASDFAYFGACAQQMSAGASFHSTDGVASRLFRPVTLTCAEHFFAAIRYIPIDCQFAPYIRGGAANHNVGNLAVVHHDLEEGTDPAALRTYGKDIGSVQYYNRLRARGVTVMNPGWSQDEEPLGVLGIGKAHK